MHLQKVSHPGFLGYFGWFSSTFFGVFSTIWGFLWYHQEGFKVQFMGFQGHIRGAFLVHFVWFLLHIFLEGFFNVFWE